MTLDITSVGILTLMASQGWSGHMSRFNIGHAAWTVCGFLHYSTGGKNYLQDQKTYVDGLLGSRHCWEACKIHEHASLHPHYSFLKYMPLITDTQRGVYRRQELPKAHTASRWWFSIVSHIWSSAHCSLSRGWVSWPGTLVCLQSLLI